jgi:hypothetical protein
MCRDSKHGSAFLFAFAAPQVVNESTEGSRVTFTTDLVGAGPLPLELGVLGHPRADLRQRVTAVVATVAVATAAVAVVALAAAAAAAAVSSAKFEHDLPIG